MAIVASGITLKTITHIAKKRKLEKLQAEWNAVGKDVVVLHMVKRAVHCPNPSPYVVKLETWLRMNDIK